SLRQIFHVTELYTKRLRVSRLTSPQLLILRAIQGKRNLTMRDLGKDVAISQSSIPSILDRLEARGLAERLRNQHDKRKVYAVLQRSAAMMNADTRNAALVPGPGAIDAPQAETLSEVI